MVGGITRWVLLLGALGFAALGQFYFAKRPNYFWDGVLFYGIAVALFLLLVRKPGEPQQQVKASAWRFNLEWALRGLLVGVGILLALLVVGQLMQPQKNYGPLFWMWCVGMACYLLAFIPTPGGIVGARGRGQDHAGKPTLANDAIADHQLLFLPRVRSWFVMHGFEFGLLVMLLIGAFLLRGWRIDTIPWTLGGDEGSQGLWARDVLAGRLRNMFGLGWLSVPNLSFYWQAAWFKLLGDNLVGLRLPWAVVGTLTVLGTYLLVRRLFDRWLALLTAFLLATYHFHIHYSRLGSNQIADPLFTVWALYFLVVGWQSTSPKTDDAVGQRRWAWAASGIVTGLAFYFYAGSRQVPIILIAALAWAVLTERDFLRSQARNLLVMLGGFLVSVAPMALVALRDPDNFNARLNQVGIIQSQWLANEVKKTGRSQWDLIAEQFRKAFFAFNFFKDRVVWYGPNMPLMDFTASIFFVLGFAVSIARLLKWRYAVFAFWFVIVIALGGALTENPPSSQRLVSSAVPAVFFVAVALRELTNALRDLLRIPEVGRRALAAGLAIVLALISVRYYFGPYQQNWVYGSFNGEVATRLGYYLRDLGPGYKEYFFGAPRMYADFGSSQFIAKGIQFHDVVQPLTRAPDFVDPKYKPVFIFLPERTKELTLIRQAYPNGVQEEVRRINDSVGPLLFTAYRP